MNEYKADCTSIIGETAIIGTGTRIWQFCNIMDGAVIGENCNIGQGCFIESSVRIGNRCKIKNNVALYNGIECEDEVFLGPNCVFTNVINPRAGYEKKSEFKKTIIRKGATIGANATIVCGHCIGSYAMVGAGSVVTKDIKPYELWYGNPAKQFGYVCRCGEKLIKEDDGFKCIKCSSRYMIVDNVMRSEKDFDCIREDYG